MKHITKIGFIFFLLFTTLSIYTTNKIISNELQTDLIIYSYDRPMQLYALLESIEKYVTGLHEIFVIIRTSNQEYAQAYQIVKDTFSHTHFIYQNAPYNDLKQLTLECFETNSTEYFLFAVDDIIVKDYINIEECAYTLKKYDAYGFFFRLGTNLDYCFAMGAAQPLPPLHALQNTDAYLWQFNQSTYDWNYPNNLDFTLYRKSDLEAPLRNCNYKTPYSLESQFMSYRDGTQYGLCHEVTKIINFPLNVVQTDWPNACTDSHNQPALLELFNRGLKIDIKVLEKIANKSAHCSDNSLIKFIPRQIPTTEKLIVIVTPSYNNKDWWEWNLTSLVNQNYHNYYILITDDCSTDGTGQAIENYIETHHLHAKVKLIKNKERRGALHNLYAMIHSCPSEAVIAIVDGDDKLPDPDVLSRLNEIYSKQNVWLTYGQFIEYPSGVQGWCTPMPDYIIQNNAFREFPHLPSHMRTFYSWLFKKIKLEDFLDSNGMFYRMTCDYATMLPMIEMAGERHIYIQDIMYVYNNANAIGDHRISRQLQAHIAQVIRDKKKYTRLQQSEQNFLEILADATADFIIISEDNRPDLVDQFLISIKENIKKGLGNIYVLFIDTYHNEIFNQLQEKYSAVIFLPIDNNRTNFRELLWEVYHNFSQSNYIIFGQANNKIIKPINLTDCIKSLEETQAYAFSLLLSKENPNQPLPSHLIVLDLSEDLCAWNYAFASDTWSCANNANMTLYRKTEKISQIFNFNLYSLADFAGTWANEGDLYKIGLCFTYPKALQS